MTANDLKTLFSNTLLSLNLDTVLIENDWQALLNLYNEPHRHYHNLSHILAMTENFLKIQHHIHDKTAVLLAIVYHDCIYHCQKQRVSNEVQSANYFKTQFNNHLPKALIDKVALLILATEKHQLLCDDTDFRYFLDLDLGILGQDWQIYQTYYENIAKEYAHINPVLYKIGRAKILRQFLKRPRIYYSAYFYQHFEILARDNIKRELKTLFF